jgi:V/A-type H+-transporting ATPase subunit E
MEELKSRLMFLQEVEIKEITEDAKKQAEIIINRARAEAERTKNEETEKIRREAQQLEENQLETEELMGRRRLADVRFQLIEKAFKEAFDRLANLAETSDKSYVNSLDKLVLEAAQEITEENLEVMAHPRDQKYLRQKLRKLEADISSNREKPTQVRIGEEPLNSVGGIALRTIDGKKIFNNTIEARIAKTRQEQLIQISKLLFEGNEN